jgi:endonuclease/exonuclease/phosphatase family metal-dependent hydrolase
MRVLTLNLWNNSGPYRRRARLIRDWIERLDPDLIGFQEALRGPSFDQVRDLLEGLPYHIKYAKAEPFWDDGSLEFGNAIAARWPIVDTEIVALPYAETSTRLAISAAIDAPVGRVSFTCTHLNWMLHHGMVREHQVVALCELILRRRVKGGFPSILLGDFNAEPDSAEIRFITGKQSIDGRSMYLHDAWRMAGDGGPGYTFSNTNPYARTALEPDRRLDYIFTGYARRDGVGLVERCEIVCNTPVDGVWPSDHFGVYAELRDEPS